MAKMSRKVGAKTKKQLIREAGGKCANPGCPNHLTDLHHIRHWGVVQAHDPAHMIALCPTCHAHVHRGNMRITDEELYQWKRIVREGQTGRGHLYIEPSNPVRTIIGRMAIESINDSVVLFQLSKSNTLSFRTFNGDIMLMNLQISSLSGNTVLQIKDNHIISHSDPEIAVEQIPGHVRVTAPLAPAYIAPWALLGMRRMTPEFGTDGRLCLLDAKVVRPGEVRIQGIWAESQRFIIITEACVFFVTPNRPLPLALCGSESHEGRTVLRYTGPITTALFKM